MRISIPPVTRGLLGLMTALSFIYFIARLTPTLSSYPNSRSRVPYLALIPSMSLSNPWTIVTSAFVEQNIVTFAVNAANIFFGGRYLERAWGSKGYALVVAVAIVVPNLLVVPTYVFWGLIMDNSFRALTPITGAITLQAAFLVAFKQLVPEHTVSIYKGMIKMRVKHFPAVFLLLNTVSGIIIGTDTAMFLSWYAFVTTWVYLRFFKRQLDTDSVGTSGVDMKGDASETFAFATFFPNAIQPPIASICNQIYILFCSMRVITPFSDEAIASGNEQAAARGEAGLPSLTRPARGARTMGKREEAERRRALALKALDQKLTGSNTRQSAAPVTVTPLSVEEQNELGQTDYKPEEE